MKDPIVIDPPGYDVAAGWKSCQDWVEQCGGIVDENGEANMWAASGADPGVTSCPNCKEYFWAFGRKIRCSECGFEFETDWWPMYSYGVGDANTLAHPERFPDPVFANRVIAGIHERMPERIKHPYYSYGFEHPVASAWDEHEQLPWKEIMKGSQP